VLNFKIIVNEVDQTIRKLRQSTDDQLVKETNTKKKKIGTKKPTTVFVYKKEKKEIKD